MSKTPIPKYFNFYSQNNALPPPGLLLGDGQLACRPATQGVLRLLEHLRRAAIVRGLLFPLEPLPGVPELPLCADGDCKVTERLKRGRGVAKRQTQAVFVFRWEHGAMLGEGLIWRDLVEEGKWSVEFVDQHKNTTKNTKYFSVA